MELFGRIATSKGNKIKLNEEYPVIKDLLHHIPSDKLFLFKTFVRTIENRINKIRHLNDKEDYVSIVEKNHLSEKEIEKSINRLIEIGLSAKEISNIIEKDMGIKISSLPESLKNKISYE